MKTDGLDSLLTVSHDVSYPRIEMNRELAAKVTGSIIQRRDTAIGILREQGVPEELVTSFIALHENSPEKVRWELPEQTVKAYPFESDPKILSREIRARRLKRLAENPDGPINTLIDGTPAIDRAMNAINGDEAAMTTLIVGLNKISSSDSGRSPEVYASLLTINLERAPINDMVLSNLFDCGPKDLVMEKETEAFLSSLSRSW